MNVLSLFDGCSCGKVALERANIKVDSYYASEIDKYAIQVAMKNHPDILQLGDIREWREWDLPKIDLVIFGSPCQGFSFAGKQLNFNDPRSSLFFTAVEILKHVKPQYFLMENVKMKKEYQDKISEILNVETILIDSALVSAQRRQRLYWSNIPDITQPDDKGIVLNDIITNGVVDRDKSYCIDANYFKGGNPSQYFNKKRRQLVFNYSSSGRGNGKVESRLYEAEKAHTLTATGYSNRSMTFVASGNMEYRKLTPEECEKLQTLDSGYTEGVSRTQRYKMLGNGFTVDVIAHILKNIRSKK